MDASGSSSVGSTQTQVLLGDQRRACEGGGEIWCLALGPSLGWSLVGGTQGCMQGTDAAPGRCGSRRLAAGPQPPRRVVGRGMDIFLIRRVTTSRRGWAPKAGVVSVMGIEMASGRTRGRRHDRDNGHPSSHDHHAWLRPWRRRIRHALHQESSRDEKVGGVGAELKRALAVAEPPYAQKGERGCGGGGS